MSAALAGALATAKAANPGAKTAAAHAREGQATTARSKKWIGAASRRSARGKSRPVEAPCAPLPPSGFEPVAFASRGKRLRHRTIRRSRFCWPANWRDISTWLVLHCSAHAEAATFGQLGLQLENGLVEIFLSMCGTLVLASCGLGERCQRAGCVAVAVLLAEWRARGSCITTRLHLNLPQS